MNAIARCARLVLAFLCGSATVAVAQTVYVVDHNGGFGSTHTTIAAAVADAVDGDLILVRQGQYDEELHIDGEGLTVQADAGHNVRISSIKVTNLTADQTAAIRGIGWIFPFELVLVLRDNDGPVWIEDVANPTDSWWQGRITRCMKVVLRNCERGDDLLTDCGRPGLDIRASTVAMYECDFEGEEGLAGAGIGGDGGPGLLVEGSMVTVYASRIVGGNGGEADGQAGNGGAGVRILSGTVQVIGSIVQGGMGGPSFFGNPGADGPDFQVLGGTVSELPNAPRFFSAPSPLRNSNSAEFTFTGEPGDHAFLMVATTPGDITNSGGTVGPLVIPPGSSLIDYGTLPASGTMTVFCSPPPAAAGTADSYFFQGVFTQGFGNKPGLAPAPGTPVEIANGTPTQVHVIGPPGP